MKKMMVLALAIGLTGVASAASLIWGSGSSQFTKDAAGTTFSQAEVGEINAAPTAGIVLVYLATEAAQSNWKLGEVVGPKATLNTGAGNKTGRVTNTSLTWTFGSGYNNGDMFAVMYRDTDGALNELKYVTDGTIIGTYTLAGIADDTSSAFLSFAPGGNFYAVPEPTSMALLAIGVAALGLRRKFRA